MKYLSLIAVVIVMPMSTNLLAVVDLYDEAPVDDAYVDSGQPNDNFNTDTLQIQGFGDEIPPVGPDLDSDEQSFLKFDVSSLEGKTLLSAVFGLYLSDASSYFTPSMQLSYVGDDAWSEDGITWTNSLPLVTDAVAIGTSEQTDELGRYYEWDVFEDWNDDELAGGFVSYMLTIEQEGFDNYAYFPSSEAIANQPYLRIEYIPEPATLILLGLGTMLIRKRRNASGRSSL